MTYEFYRSVVLQYSEKTRCLDIFGMKGYTFISTQDMIPFCKGTNLSYCLSIGCHHIASNTSKITLQAKMCCAKK